jgi:hypothetical protein
MAIGWPAGSPDANAVARVRSSHGQYATAALKSVVFFQYRVIAEPRGLEDWPRRRSSPLPCTVAQIMVAVGSNRCGHDGISPWNRYRRLLSSAVPVMVHVLDWASAKLVAPAVCAVKSGDALTVPPIPDRSLNEWTLP